MNLKVLSAVLMSASLSAFVISCDEYGKKRTETVEPATPAPQERAEAKEEAAETRKDIKEEAADNEMDLTQKVSELEKEWNEVEAKLKQRADLRDEYQTLSRDIETKIQNMKTQIDQMEKSGAPDTQREQLEQGLEDLEKQIDAAEERLG